MCWHLAGICLVLISSILNAQEIKPIPGGHAPFVGILERTSYIDLSPLDLTNDQKGLLAELRAEWDAAQRQFEKEEAQRDQPRDFREWSDEQDPAIERKLRAVLTPTQVDWLIIEDNYSWLLTRSNAPSEKSEFGSIYGSSFAHELFGLSQVERDAYKELDKKWGKKIKDLREGLAKLEDKMAEELNEKLRKILDGEQRAKYDELIGDPVTVAEPFTAIARLKSGLIYPNSPPTIIERPRKHLQLSSAHIEIVAQSLVFVEELENDLALVPSQQKQWDILRSNLEESIKPHQLSIVLSSLGVPVGVLDMNDLVLEEQSPRISRAEAQKMALSACSKAFEVLLPKQQQWLRQVALQYYVASSGGKFPLRFDWVRSQVNVRSDQARQLDELLEEHDNKLNELVPEYVERDRKLRDEAEREFYDVLTDAQKKTLALYLGPPKWETDEKDK
jgi:hypothetical protein